MAIRFLMDDDAELWAAREAAEQARRRFAMTGAADVAVTDHRNFLQRRAAMVLRRAERRLQDAEGPAHRSIA